MAEKDLGFNVLHEVFLSTFIDPKTLAKNQGFWHNPFLNPIPRSFKIPGIVVQEKAAMEEPTEQPNPQEQKPILDLGLGLGIELEHVFDSGDSSDAENEFQKYKQQQVQLGKDSLFRMNENLMKMVGGPTGIENAEAFVARVPKARDETRMGGAGDEGDFKSQRTIDERKAAMADPGPLGVGGGLGAGLGVGPTEKGTGIEYTAKKPVNARPEYDDEE